MVPEYAPSRPDSLWRQLLTDWLSEDEEESVLGAAAEATEGRERRNDWAA